MAAPEITKTTIGGIDVLHLTPHRFGTPNGPTDGYRLQLDGDFFLSAIPHRDRRWTISVQDGTVRKFDHTCGAPEAAGFIKGIQAAHYMSF